MTKLKNLYYLISIVKNWPSALKSFLFPINRNKILHLRSKHSIFIREDSTDIHEVIAVLSGRDYPISLLNELPNNPLVLDIGAHIGTFTLLIKTIYPNSRIIAFEPNADNFMLLKKNIKHNNLSHVKCFQTALANRTGVSSFTDMENFNENRIDINGELLVKTITLSNIQKFINDPIDLLKLDCEGSEYDIISSKFNYSRIRYIVMEYHNQGVGKNDQFLIKYLGERKFKLVYHYPTPSLNSGILIFRNLAFRTS